jgi:branched-chain amino acid transport system permease protein
VLGGSLSVLGPIVGTAAFMALPELARPFAENREIIMGVILIAVVVYFPDGIVDSANRYVRRWRRARRSHA